MMKIQKRDGSYAEYDESKVVQAVMKDRVGPRKAAELARGVTRRLRRPLTVSKVGDLTEDAMLKAGLYAECRQYIEHRTKRRLEREKRAIITGGVDENLKYLRASTLKVLRAAGSDISHTICSIRPKCEELMLSGLSLPYWTNCATRSSKSPSSMSSSMSQVMRRSVAVYLRRVASALMPWLNSCRDVMPPDLPISFRVNFMSCIQWNPTKVTKK